MSKRAAKPKTVPPPGGYVIGKNPRASLATATPIQNVHPSFSFKHLDRENRDGWKWPDADGVKEIVDYLCVVSNSSWKDLRNQSTGNVRRRPLHHSQPIESLPTKAQKIITDLRLNEIVDEFFRFRMGGTKRLWGFVINGVFYIVWWDPDHKVYPTDPN
jgi:hypothetical protein